MKNPLTIEAFADWCEKQPADKSYSYSNCSGHCAYGQYLVALGLPVDFVSIDFWKDTEGTHHELPAWVDRMVLGAGYFAHDDHTFGALAERLRSGV